MSTRLALPNRREHTTQKVRIGNQRMLYISVHDDAHPAEMFLRLKGADCSSELIGLYDVIASFEEGRNQPGAALQMITWALAHLRVDPILDHDRPFRVYDPGVVCGNQ